MVIHPPTYLPIVDTSYVIHNDESKEEVSLIGTWIFQVGGGRGGVNRIFPDA